MLHKEDYSQFQKALLVWFAEHRRPLPWRQKYEPYHVWVSEIMLQQTQMERGVSYFKRWMQALPDISSVAAAHEDTVLKLWEGLGYYSRVRNLHKAAQAIMERHGGKFPSAIEDIRALPGIGEYTAGAIASIAFNQDVPCIDANVERVFARIFDIDTPVKEKQNMAFIRSMAHELLPSGHARDWNQALMEFGALICSRAAKCGECPVSHWCEANHLGIVAERPVPRPKKPLTHIDVATGVLIHQGKIYIQKRPETGVWPGFWELPGGTVEEGETPEQTVVREYMEEMEFAVTPVTDADKIAVINHGYTTYRVTLHCYRLRMNASAGDESESGSHDNNGLSVQSDVIHGPEDGIVHTADRHPVPILHAATDYRWVTLSGLDEVTLPAGHRKLADMLKSDPELLSRVMSTNS